MLTPETNDAPAKPVVRTRFAPSPTGRLHIGSVRAALFPYLFAKHNGGEFILRIEDTDRTRSTKEYEKEILEGLNWMGLFWDEGPVDPDKKGGKGAFGPYRQTERMSIYQKYIKKLLKNGLGYERNGAVWFRIPEERRNNEADRIRFYDLLRGEVSVPTNTIEDFVIVKSDGTPLFLLTNVIDDHEMQITHAIRGEDHISNTPKQVLIAEALGLNLPKYAHVPLILNPDRSKMSKRVGSTALFEFREEGYLPEAIINFLAFLGWSPGDDREFFTKDQLIQEFRLERVGKSGSAFNVDKLDHMNAHYIRETDLDRLVEMILADFWDYHVLGKRPEDMDYMRAVVTLVRDRMVKLNEFPQLAKFFFKTPRFGAQLLIFKKSDRKKTLHGLELATKRLEGATESAWTNIDALRDILSFTVKNNDLTNGDVFWPVRVALSGAEASPAPDELLFTLGREQSLERLKAAYKELLKP
jgi:glutamyl-tRNA synthetase